LAPDELSALGSGWHNGEKEKMLCDYAVLDDERWPKQRLLTNFFDGFFDENTRCVRVSSLPI
jgi:hypothetical protein